MITPIKFVPFLLGGALVVQSSLNKTIAESKGLSTACLINGSLVAIFSLILLLLSHLYPQFFSDIIPFNKNNKWIFKWWYLIPGIIGFCLVVMLPLGIMKIGALPVFLGVIAGQIIISLLYDFYFEKIPINTIRVAGALLTFIGAVLVIWKR